MKLMVRVSVFALVFAGAVASAFSSRTSNFVPASQSTFQSNYVVSTSMPIPDCEPGTPGCLP
jgi:hypothetical protein